MENESKTITFEEEAGRNLFINDEANAEELLKTIYLWWIEEKPILTNELCIKLNISVEELDDLLDQLVDHGYIELKEKEPELTSLGKAQGAEYINRNQQLTQFIQKVCGMEEEQAQENASRMGRVVSGEVVRGISDFLKTGVICERMVKSDNLHFMYEEGVYEFCMCIYRMEERYPRLLAEEFYVFYDMVSLEVGSNKSSFYLQPKDNNHPPCLWYINSSGWEKAEKVDRGFRIPVGIFSFAICEEELITEGNCIIAFPEGDTIPSEQESRELNVHIWKRGKRHGKRR
ncbi:MAG: iron dependent repressor, metal binding and dimerization domain protein [Lachnospiraceae bacterium]